MGRRKIDAEARRLSVGVTLPYGLVKALDIKAAEKDTTRSTIIERAILYYLMEVEKNA